MLFSGCLLLLLVSVVVTVIAVGSFFVLYAPEAGTFAVFLRVPGVFCVLQLLQTFWVVSTPFFT